MTLVLRSVAALTALIAIATATAHAAPGANPLTSCPTIHATAWRFPHTQFKGNTYGSYVVGGYKCGTAATWIKKFSRDDVQEPRLRSLERPYQWSDGFSCKATPTRTGTPSPAPVKREREPPRSGSAGAAGTHKPVRGLSPLQMGHGTRAECGRQVADPTESRRRASVLRGVAMFCWPCRAITPRGSRGCEWVRDG